MKVAGVESLFLNYIAPCLLGFLPILITYTPHPSTVPAKKTKQGHRWEKKKIIALYF